MGDPGGIGPEIAVKSVKYFIEEGEYIKPIIFGSFENIEYISKYIVSLGITARDPLYVRRWWTRPRIVSTERGNWKVYGTEHPRSSEDLRKIFNGFNNLFPQFLNEPNVLSGRIYAASIIIQNFRRSILKGAIKEIDPSLRGIYVKVKENLNLILRELKTFKIESASKIQLLEDVEPYVMLENFDKYVKL